MTSTRSGNRRSGRQRPHHLDHLVTNVVEIAGRDVSYAVGGRGLPVLFLHGWGLDHRAYRRSLKRLTTRGCRVVAPTLPGFGGTTGLPIAQRTLSGYADWVAEFLDEVGLDGPFVVLGHSFGGGVATRLAVDHPQRVTNLVLVNSIGDPRSFRPGWRPRTARPIGTPGAVQALDLMRPTASGANARRSARAFVENSWRGPLTMAQTARLALASDLRGEMEVLALRSLPVMVLWSDRDAVIPYGTFDTFCQVIGADGHVVAGGHSWLLSAPDSFGQVLANLVAIEGARHRSAVLGATTDELQVLLGRTTMPKRLIGRRLEELSSLWLLSASAEVLAADLTLCHPALAPDEVRAVIRPLDGGNAHRLTVLAADRPGLLAETAGILASEGISVDSASVQTWADDRLAMHALTFRSDPSTAADHDWDRIGRRLRERRTRSWVDPAPAAGPATVTVTGSGDGSSVVRISASDRIGLLSMICGWFADHGVSVESAGVSTVGGAADDVFVVRGDFDDEALRRHLSGRRPSAMERLGRRDLGDVIRSALIPAPFVDFMLGSPSVDTDSSAERG